MSFLAEHWTRIYSTNPTGAAEQRSEAAGQRGRHLPNVAAVERLTGAVLLEINDEWQVERRYFSLASMRKLLEPEALLPTEPMPLRLAPVH
jgi:putative transposase